MSQKDEEVVRTFLNEAVLELGMGNVDVFYTPRVEVASSEPAFYSFFHRCIYVEVVENRVGPWAQVEYENIEDCGVPDMAGPLWDAVTATGRVIKTSRDFSEDQRRHIKASWDASHQRGVNGVAGLIRKAMTNGQDGGCHE